MRGNRISSAIRHDVWRLYYDGVSLKKIAKLVVTSEGHVSDIVQDFLRAEKDKKRKQNEEVLFEDTKSINGYLIRQRIQAQTNFVLMTNNKKVKQLAKKLGFYENT